MMRARFSVEGIWMKSGQHDDDGRQPRMSVLDNKVGSRRLIVTLVDRMRWLSNGVASGGKEMWR
jgi:hypothetical protein